jgi:NTP pyrophosphatase (non-canonical NTP hydrolase)
VSASDDVTSIRALREAVAAFVAERDWEQFHAPKNLAMALACESSEVMEEMLWMTTDESRAIAGERLNRVTAEIGDVGICLLNLCNQLGIDLAAAVEKKLADAAAKYPAEKVRGQSKKWQEYPDK